MRGRIGRGGAADHAAQQIDGKRGANVTVIAGVGCAVVAERRVVGVDEGIVQDSDLTGVGDDGGGASLAWNRGDGAVRLKGRALIAARLLLSGGGGLILG